jgi:hypothetical protein
VAARERGEVILVRRAGVEDVRSGVEELDIAELKNHVQANFHASILQDLKGIELLRRQRGNFAGVREALERLDEVGVRFGEDAWVVARLEVEKGHTDVLLLAEGGLALAVKVPDWLCEGLGDVGAFALDGVPDVLGGGEVGFAAFEGTGYAEEADDVAVVDVEELTVAGLA